MPVYLSTKAFELLQTRRPRQTAEQSSKFTRQRGNDFALHNRLSGELKRQYHLQEEKKRDLATSLFPLISQKTKCVENVGRKMHFKIIKNRIPSATRTPSGREVSLCDRGKREDLQMGRHFCELLGPRFCVDCTKAKERNDALRDCEERPTTFHLERDPFTALVCNHLTKEFENDDSDSDEEIFDNASLDQDELSDLDELTGTAEKRDNYPHAVSNVVFTPSRPGKGIRGNPSSPWRGDSGYSSRVSHIRELTRAKSCSVLRNSPLFSPLRREKTHAPTIKQNPADSRQSSGFDSPTREFSFESHGFLDTIEKLQKRRQLNRHKFDDSKSWLKCPVEPVLMELKLINFTQYDKLGYEPLPPEPCDETPAFAVDEFGFPIMETIAVSSS